MSAAPRARIKPGKASLFGGMAVAVAVLVLWMAVARELGASGWLVLAGGVLLAAGVGAWIRIADL